MANPILPRLKLSNLRDELNTSSLSFQSLTPYSVDKDRDTAVEVLPGLFVSGFGAVCNENLLASLKIDTIINLVKGLPNKFPLKFKYINYSLKDDGEIGNDQNLINIITDIKENLDGNKRVLVHCRKGISRSPAAIIGFLIKHKGFPMEQAFEFVRAKKRDIDPNLGFLLQLQRL